MKTLIPFIKFKLSKQALKNIVGGNDYNNCRAECYSEMAVGCENDPTPGGQIVEENCLASGYNWCDGYCGSGV